MSSARPATATRRWLATADALPARAARRMVRGVLRARARARAGSVAAEMDRIVAEAVSAESGTGLPPDLARRRDERHRSRRAPTPATAPTAQEETG
jgi:hypothetical protein